MISLGLVTTTHYKIGGSVATPRFGGLLHMGTRVTGGGCCRVPVRTDVSGDNVGCRQVKRGQGPGENSC